YEYRSWIESTKNRLETTSIRFSNQSNNHINIGDSLRVDGYFPLIPSNEYRHIPVNTPVLINTYKQIINNSLKQYCWNDLIEDHFLVHQTSFDEESDDYAIFNITSGINVSTNILFVPDGIDFYDPWYAYQEDGEWIQPDEFIQLNELTNDGNYNVFLDQGGTDIGNLTQPYYSLRTPIYVTDGDDTYLFDGWSGTNMSFDKLSPETPVVFHQPGSEITANYEQVQSMEQQLTIPPGFVNLISFNVLPDNPAIASIFAGVDNIMIQDDHGGFFVPGFSVNTIGDVDIVEGYKIDYWDLETVNLTVPGLPAYSHSEITINENNSMNYFPYLGRDPMDINYAFADVFEDILIVQSDMGGYYIPVYNINSIYTLYPGEAYYFTSSATYDIKYRLPRPSAQRQISEENMEEIIHQTASNYFHPQKTGSSFPVLIDPQFDIHVGDEIVAYSGDMVVGTSRVANPSEPNLIVIWNEVNENGQHLRGYNDGSPLYFRLWDNDLQIEIELLGELESHPYGDIVLKTGEFELGPVITPQKYQLYPPYPNPFNPNTTLRYDLPIRSDVSVIIYDMLGREVTLLVNSIQNAGYHLIQWDATDYATGTYFVKMTTGEVTQTQKIMLLK
ncbi:MAG: T9SS type A sorting domain-containing protein, partial [Fidelibacterota bacterium]